MRIQKVTIENFRGITGTFEDLPSDLTIIGRNDSGKSNFCYALRKVLDIKERRQPFVESDSTDSNCQEIKISLVISLDGISANNRALLGTFIDQEGSIETVTVELIGTYDSSCGVYNETLSLGSLDKRGYSFSNSNPLDSVLTMMYVGPVFDVETDKTRFFEYHKKNNEDNSSEVGNDVKKALTELNSKIKSDAAIGKIQSCLDGFTNFDSIFDGVKFEIKSNIEIHNFYKSLKVISKIGDKEVSNIGDGKYKTLSLLFQILSMNDEKEKIIIIEEPENHLYPLLQREYASCIESLDVGQRIITTHSPFIFDFKKDKRIYKFFRDNGIFTYKTLNFDSDLFYKKYAYLIDDDFAESLFYDEVLLVEGYSERLFINYIIRNFPGLFETIEKRKLFVLPVYGIDFKPVYDALTSLGIKTYVLTDNDIIGVPYHSDLCDYSGMNRLYNLLDANEKNRVDSVYQHPFKFVKGSKDEEDFKKAKDVIINIFKANGLLIEDLDFENSLMDLLGFKGEERDNLIGELTNKKLKNLHTFLINNIDLSKADFKRWKQLNYILYGED